MKGIAERTARRVIKAAEPILYEVGRRMFVQRINTEHYGRGDRRAVARIGKLKGSGGGHCWLSNAEMRRFVEAVLKLEAQADVGRKSG